LLTFATNLLYQEIISLRKYLELPDLLGKIVGSLDNSQNTKSKWDQLGNICKKDPGGTHTPGETTSSPGADE